MKTPISILAEIPEELHESLKSYLETHPTWDQDRVFAAALSLFLMQNRDNKEGIKKSDNYRTCARIYLENIFEEN